MVKVKIGRGVIKKIGKVGYISLGLLEAKVTNRHRNFSLEDIARALGKQCKIRDGCITIHHISFSYSISNEV